MCSCVATTTSRRALPVVSPSRTVSRMCFDDPGHERRVAGQDAAVDEHLERRLPLARERDQEAVAQAVAVHANPRPELLRASRRHDGVERGRLLGALGTGLPLGRIRTRRFPGEGSSSAVASSMARILSSRTGTVKGGEGLPAVAKVRGGQGGASRPGSPRIRSCARGAPCREAPSDHVGHAPLVQVQHHRAAAPDRVLRPWCSIVSFCRIVMNTWFSDPPVLLQPARLAQGVDGEHGPAVPVDAHALAGSETRPGPARSAAAGSPSSPPRPRMASCRSIRIWRVSSQMARRSRL